MKWKASMAIRRKQINKHVGITKTMKYGAGRLY